jgi:hypothetical protein
MKAKHEEWHRLEQVAMPALKEKHEQVTAKQLSKGRPPNHRKAA